MSLTGAVVVFTLVWWMVFFTMLPVGVRGQHEANEVVPGSEPGAPVAPDLKRKALWTTMIAVPLTILIEIALTLGWLGPWFSTGR